VQAVERNCTPVEVEAMTMIGTQTTWTTERIALLRNRIDAGISCGQIAREIGVSRNAVIGKAQHKNLRASQAKPQIAFGKVSGDSANRCSLFELQQWHCRWPISEPGAEDFGFCGSKMVDGLPYCEAHARMAYRPGRRGSTARSLTMPLQCGAISRPF
jgi:GcrA cell cycle regulator